MPFSLPLASPLAGSSSVMGMDDSVVERYRDLAIKLLPRGRGLTKRVETALGAMLTAVAVEYARLNDRLSDLLMEAFPGTATEKLTEWEKAVGLPNACTALLTDLVDRRNAVLAQFHTGLGQHSSDFQSIATTLGYPIGMVTYDVWRCGKTAIGRPIRGHEWFFAAQVNYEKQADTTDAVLECSLEAHAHAHTQLNFAGWDSTTVDILPTLRHHYVAGEFVVVSDEITEWTNRESANHWDTSTDFPIVGSAEGWSTLNLESDTDILHIEGPTHSASGSVDANTLIAERDFHLFMVVQMDVNDATHNLLADSGGDFVLRTQPDGAGHHEAELVYGSTTLNAPMTFGQPTLITVGASATTVSLGVNGNPVFTGSSATSSVTGNQVLKLGDGFRGQVFEIVSSDNDEFGFIAAAVNASLKSKYGIQ